MPEGQPTQVTDTLAPRNSEPPAEGRNRSSLERPSVYGPGSYIYLANLADGAEV